MKLKVSVDGKVRLAGRQPVAISGQAARARVHLMSAQYDAILIGVGTALADNPLLTCRLPGMASRSPERVVLDSALRLPRDSALAATARDTPLWLLCGANAPVSHETALSGAGATVRIDEAQGRLDLAQALMALASRGITRLLVEGGPTVAASLIGAGLADEVALIRSDLVIGTDGIPAIEGASLTEVTQSPDFHLRDSELVGNDHLEIYERT